ncbi:hypothetical protein T484DRAFT_1766505 [Baffinella frigidus]|nr:hypothetical protein T484DRAFT_1766505 [Cryptophyta sp. CCMP2293]
MPGATEAPGPQPFGLPPPRLDFSRLQRNQASAQPPAAAPGGKVGDNFFGHGDRVQQTGRVVPIGRSHGLLRAAHPNGLVLREDAGVPMFLAASMFVNTNTGVNKYTSGGAPYKAPAPIHPRTFWTQHANEAVAKKPPTHPANWHHFAHDAERNWLPGKDQCAIESFLPGESRGKGRGMHTAMTPAPAQGSRAASAGSRPGSAAGSRPGSATAIRGKTANHAGSQPPAFWADEEGFGDNTRAGKAWKLREMLKDAQEMTLQHHQRDRVASSMVECGSMRADAWGIDNEAVLCASRLRAKQESSKEGISRRECLSVGGGGGKDDWGKI